MLPRPSLFEVAEPYVCYSAIGNLTKDLSNLHYDMKNIPEDIKLDEISNALLEREEWYIVEHDVRNDSQCYQLKSSDKRLINFVYSHKLRNGEGAQRYEIICLE